ncbi:hypothetical protein GE061_000176 [Apolygus lucorum]|uniref:Mannosyltransferase n=1 Tax=Apolygus lucorum TaxID=248454 RepID=A0A8S9Y5I7_APOLU|nr:hypothetical protein GE061_000176 [Apolygus lucorum]
MFPGADHDFLLTDRSDYFRSVSMCPFTSHEEHFNMQAMHDILYHGSNLTQFDHIEFPGVILPQTFIGAVFISVLASPLNYVIENCGLPGITKYSAQLIVRASLGACVICCLKLFQNAVKERFGKQVADWFIFMSCTQFHFMFYSTRAIPCIMVMPLVLLSFRYWLLEKYDSFMWIATASVIIFKFELIILFGLILMHEVFNHRISFKRLMYTLAPATAVFLAITVVVDSCIWQRFTWPEGEAFLKGLLGKHHHSGTSPFLWYWYSALPRALGLSVFFVPFGAYLERRMVPLFSICAAFIVICSFQQRKELRYIIYVFPIMNLIASCGCNILWNGRQKSLTKWALSIGAAAHMIGNVIITITLLSIAHKNYPGGSAIQNFHNAILPEQDVHIYIDEVAIQSGVTRFTQTNDQWTYNTTGNINLETADVSEFTHLMIEARSKYSKNLKPFFKSHDIIDTIEGFSHIHVSYQSFPPLRVKTKPILSILQRKIPYTVATRKRSGDVPNTGKMKVKESWLVDPSEKLDSVPIQNVEDTQFDDQNSDDDDFEFDAGKAHDPLFESSLENLDSDKLDVDQSVEEETKKSTRALVDSLIRAKKLKSMSPEWKSPQIESVHEDSAASNESDFHPSEYGDVRKDFAASREESLHDVEMHVKATSIKINRPMIKNRRTKTSSRAFDALQDVPPEEEGNKLLDTSSKEPSVVSFRRKNQVLETVQNVNEIDSPEVDYRQLTALEELKPRSLSTSYGAGVLPQDLIALPPSNELSAADESSNPEIYAPQKLPSVLNADSINGKTQEKDANTLSKAYDSQLDSAVQIKSSAARDGDGSNPPHLKVFEVNPTLETPNSQSKFNSSVTREVSAVGVVPQKTTSLQLGRENYADPNLPSVAVESRPESTNVPKLRRSRYDNVMIWWNIVDTLRDRDQGNRNPVNNNAVILKNKLYDGTVGSTESTPTSKNQPISS